MDTIEIIDILSGIPKTYLNDGSAQCECGNFSFAYQLPGQKWTTISGESRFYHLPGDLTLNWVYLNAENPLVYKFGNGEIKISNGTTGFQNAWSLMVAVEYLNQSYQIINMSPSYLLLGPNISNWITPTQLGNIPFAMIDPQSETVAFVTYTSQILLYDFYGGLINSFQGNPFTIKVTESVIAGFSNSEGGLVYMNPFNNEVLGVQTLSTIAKIPFLAKPPSSQGTFGLTSWVPISVNTNSSEIFLNAYILNMYPVSFVFSINGEYNSFWSVANPYFSELTVYTMPSNGFIVSTNSLKQSAGLCVVSYLTVDLSNESINNSDINYWIIGVCVTIIFLIFLIIYKKRHSVILPTTVPLDSQEDYQKIESQKKDDSVIL